MIHNIFYRADKTIAWSTTGMVNDAIIAAQQTDAGLSHVALELTDHPDENFYVNADATALVEKSVFDFSFSTTRPAVDEVVTVTGVPEGTKVYRDGELILTTTDSNPLTLTTQEPGQYTIKFQKLHYKEHNGTIITTKRYGE